MKKIKKRRRRFWWHVTHVWNFLFIPMKLLLLVPFLLLFSLLFFLFSGEMDSKWGSVLTASSIFSGFDDLKWITSEFDQEVLFTKRPVTGEVETAIGSTNDDEDEKDVKPLKVLDSFTGGGISTGNLTGAADFENNLVSPLSLSHTTHLN